MEAAGGGAAAHEEAHTTARLLSTALGEKVGAREQHPWGQQVTCPLHPVVKPYESYGWFSGSWSNLGGTASSELPRTCRGVPG